LVPSLIPHPSSLPKHPAMKNILLAICLLVVPVMAFSQTRALNKFYRQHKRGADVQNMKVPGWLIRFGGKIAIKNSDSGEDEKIALDLLKKLGTVRIMHSEEGVQIPAKAIKKLQNELRQDHFDDLIQIRSGQMDFQLMIRERDGLISELFMLYNDREEGEMAFISAKTKLHLDDLKELLKKEMGDKLQPVFDLDEEPEAEPTL
jgi:hypothetical protein